jgi:prenyltransferase beta subunit
MKKSLLAAVILLLAVRTVGAQAGAPPQTTVAYLHGLQVADSGFRQNNLPATKESLRATLASLRALKYFHDSARNRPACVRFVKHCYDNSSGGFADHPGGQVDVMSTAVGAMALAELDMPLGLYQEWVSGYLVKHAKSFEEIRLAAAAFEATGWTSPQFPAWLKQISALRNKDGTYGEGNNQARMTASAVVSVLRLGGKVEQRENVVRALKAGQRGDGGFGKDMAAVSDLESCYRVVRALVMLKERANSQRCLDFVAGCHNKDGGYGAAPGEPSSATATYQATMLRHWLEEKEK